MGMDGTGEMPMSIGDHPRLVFLDSQEFVIITGVSGAGRRTAAHTMEDLGWYVVDNLPAAMLPVLADELAASGITRIAVVVDVRSLVKCSSRVHLLVNLQK